MSLIIDWLYPVKCYGCHLPGVYLCPLCQHKLVEEGIRQFKPELESVLSLYKYNGIIRQMITDIKFGFVADLADTLAESAAKTIQSSYPNILRYWHDFDFCFTPVPLHWYRHRWRGFNQSELVGKKLSQQLNIPYRIILGRKSSRHQQVGLSRKMRSQNLNSVFQYSGPNVPLRLVLFDDVCTTGSTLKSVASTLPEGSEVWGLTLAG